jgi:hypothetical protein
MSQTKAIKPKKKIKKPNLFGALLTSPGVLLLSPAVLLWVAYIQPAIEKSEAARPKISSDGTEITNPDGTKTITNPDGSTTIEYPDGSKKTWHVGGGTTTVRPIPTISPQEQRQSDLESQKYARRGLSPAYDSVPLLNIEIQNQSQNIVLDAASPETAQEKFQDFKTKYEKAMAQRKGDANRVWVSYVPPRTGQNLSVTTLHYGNSPAAKLPLTVIEIDTKKVYTGNGGNLTLADKTEKALEYLFGSVPLLSWEEAKQAADRFFIEQFKTGHGRVVGKRIVGKDQKTFASEVLYRRTVMWTDERAKSMFPE